MKQLNALASLTLILIVGMMLTYHPTFAQINQEETSHMLVGKINLVVLTSCLIPLF